MPSLVADFIINPVLRQARRFSTGFATEEPPALRHQRTRSAGESDSVASNAILEGDCEDNERTVGNNSREGDSPAVRASDPRHRPEPNPDLRTSPSERTPDHSAVISSGTSSTVRSPQFPPRPELTGRTEDRASRLAWIEEGSRATPLPEDDGNGELRKKILAIQAMDVSQTLKAQLMHQLLMEGYNKPRGAPPTSPGLHPESPISRSVPDRPDSGLGGPLQALKFWNPLSDGPGPLNLPLTESDLRPTYVPNIPPSDADTLALQFGNMELEDHGQPFLGCEHYRRNVKMQCATCERWYTCRFCHDAVEDHILPRKDTKHMLCMICGCPQKASDTCTRCGGSAAYYFCGVCKLWNDDPNKPIYHCSDCGLCRVGQGLGKDFFHCKKCMTCIKMTGTYHRCIERSTDCDCPICGEYMFNSPRPVMFMQCGHSIHGHCFQEHKRTSYKCPLCNKSCYNMDAQFRGFDMTILAQPMPEEYRDSRAIISCNDCSAKSQTSYHWLGLKCPHCLSYNTVQLQLLNMPGQQPEPSNTATSVPTSATWGPRTLPTRDVATRRLSDHNPPEVGALDRELRRRARARERAEGVTGPSLLSRLFAPRGSAPSSPSSHLTSASATASSTANATDLPRSESETLIHGVTNAAVSSNATAATTAGRGLNLADGTDDSDLEADDEDMLDFWGRSGDDTHVSDGGADGEAEEEEESSSSEEEDGCDEDDDDDEEEEIVLLGHR